MASLTPLVDRVHRQTSSALTLLATLPRLRGVSRHYIAELIVIRTFALFESIIEDAACRLVCGATYHDGTAATLLRPRPTHGIARARQAMSEYNRTAPRTRLRWNKASEIRANLEELFPATEHFVITFHAHSAFVSDLRKVRNHIAHANAGTRIGFQQVVADYYGASVPALTPGRLLLSPRFVPTVAERWCRQASIVLRAALRA
jgi:hypothetical protein